MTTTERTIKLVIALRWIVGAFFMFLLLIAILA